MAKRISARDRKAVVEMVKDELARRKTRREDREKRWKEIDRQLAMEPVKRNLDQSGMVIPGTEWMPEQELPWQSQAQEILVSDARRLLFPDDRDYFSAHVALTDDYLGRMDFEAIITGDVNEVPSLVNQENADFLLEGIHQHYQSLYDFRGHIDLINGEAFNYGTGLGRGELVFKDKFFNTPDGIVRKTRKIPVLKPVSIRTTYLDDNPQVYGGQMISKAVISERQHGLADLKRQGGWQNLAQLEADKNGNVKLLEYEGDVVVHRSKENLFFPNIVVTISGDHIVKWQEMEFHGSSYLEFPYHKENIGAYAESPLGKAMPIQKAASLSFSRMMAVAILDAEPPLGYNPDDPAFVASGGPRIEPRALWESLSPVVPAKIGDLSAQLAVYVELKRQYEEITGVNAPRLGAQTKSHQTAFAVDQEQQRGQIRTVDYTRSTRHAPMREWLYMELEMLRKAMKKENIYIEKYGGYVTVDAKALPDEVTYDVHGNAGPIEEQQKLNLQIQALQQLIQLQPFLIQAKQAGLDPDNEIEMPDFNKIQKDILRKGGYIAPEEFFTSSFEGGAVTAPLEPGVSGVAGLAAPTPLETVG